MTILSGGEPLTRPDILELAGLRTSMGFRLPLSTNGANLTEKSADDIKKAGAARLSLSLDAPNPTGHDEFRGQAGSFETTVESAKLLKRRQPPFQINSAITARNIRQTEAISELALSSGAVAHHVFLLVPAGRTKQSDTNSLPQAYEQSPIKLKQREGRLKLEFKATCAPQYRRIGLQLGLKPSPRSSRGCLGGRFMFIGHDGQVGACGRLRLPAGNARQARPVEIYDASPLFAQLRDKKCRQGRCGRCDFFDICGGCRAGAYAQGDRLGPEPLCPHQPKNSKGDG
jgi:radical SAM protein with 4Fe4S-binding SPASM domain